MRSPFGSLHKVPNPERGPTEDVKENYLKPTGLAPA